MKNISEYITTLLFINIATVILTSIACAVHIASNKITEYLGRTFMPGIKRYLDIFTVDGYLTLFCLTAAPVILICCGIPVSYSFCFIYGMMLSAMLIAYASALIITVIAVSAGCIRICFTEKHGKLKAICLFIKSMDLSYLKPQTFLHFTKRFIIKGD